MTSPAAMRAFHSVAGIAGNRSTRKSSMQLQPPGGSATWLGPTPSRTGSMLLGLRQPACALEPPGAVGFTQVHVIQRAGCFLQPGVQRHAVVEHEAFALPVNLRIGHLLKVIED